MVSFIPCAWAQDEESVQWGSLFQQSLLFLGVEHSFRIATDPGTRAGLKGSFLGGYVNSVDNLHGWADGDPFIVNYVGHPMQGSISGDIWVHNDPRFRTAEIGRNRRYWVGRLRAVAFAWAYSEQFEIGPISEASIGHVQSRFPQQGFVDHVITPTMGGAWMIAEDAVDRFVIKNIERHTESPLVKLLARTVLNPSRTFANSMELDKPWMRENRPGLFGVVDFQDPTPGGQVRVVPKDSAAAPETNIPSFEFATNFNTMVMGGSGRALACAGGGGSGTFNLNRVVGIETDISGCKMLGVAPWLSGDALTFAAGPRFSYRSGSRWTPWVNVLVGGEKLTQEWFSQSLKDEVLASAPPGADAYVLHTKYTRDYDSTGFRVSLGGGLDYDLNRSVAFRVGSLEYAHTWAGSVNGESYPDSARLTMGMVLRIGD